MATDDKRKSRYFIILHFWKEQQILRSYFCGPRFNFIIFTTVKCF
jgi:hypothetical protein